MSVFLMRKSWHIIFPLIFFGVNSCFLFCFTLHVSSRFMRLRSSWRWITERRKLSSASEGLFPQRWVACFMFCLRTVIFHFSEIISTPSSPLRFLTRTLQSRWASRGSLQYSQTPTLFTQRTRAWLSTLREKCPLHLFYVSISEDFCSVSSFSWIKCYETYRGLL